MTNPVYLLPSLAAIVTKPVDGSGKTHELVHETFLGLDSSMWVSVAILIFFLVAVFKFKLPALITGALDSHIAKIRFRFDESQKVRQEAEEMLAEIKTKYARVHDEVEAIMSQARREAHSLHKDLKNQTEALRQRRMALANAKIATTTEAATREVKQMAATIALSASRNLCITHLDDQHQSRLVNQFIDQLGKLD